MTIIFQMRTYDGVVVQLIGIAEIISCIIMLCSLRQIHEMEINKDSTQVMVRSLGE